jgi:hypothetical protein
LRREWWAPLTGVAFVVVLIVGVIIGGEPLDADSPVREIIDHYTDNKTSIEVASFVGAAAAVLLVFFGAYLRSVLSAAEGPGGMLSALTLLGTAVVAVGLAIDITIGIALAEAAEDIEPAAVQALQAVWDSDFVPLALGAGVPDLYRAFDRATRCSAEMARLGRAGTRGDRVNPDRFRRLRRSGALDRGRTRDAGAARSPGDRGGAVQGLGTRVLYAGAPRQLFPSRDTQASRPTS